VLFYWIRGDQAGSEALPGVSTRRSLRPVTSIDQIWALVDDLLAVHDEWLPAWARVGTKIAAE